jgi:hypothetical protein
LKKIVRDTQATPSLLAASKSLHRLEEFLLLPEIDPPKLPEPQLHPTDESICMEIVKK